MKKIIFLLIIALTVRAAAVAQGQLMRNSNQTNYQWQTDPTIDISPKVEKLFNESQFIFDGEIIASKEYQASDKKRYTAYKIKIKKVFRGNLNVGTIEILRADEFLCHRLNYDNSIILFDNPDHSYLPTNGIYFCTLSNYSTTGDIQCVWTMDKGYNANETDFSPSDNTIKVTPIRTLSGLSLPIGYGEIIKFSTNTELYQFFEKYGDGNITIPKDTEQEKPTKQNYNSISVTNKNQIDYAKRQKNYNDYMQYLQTKLQNKNGSSNKSAGMPCKEFFISEYIDGPNKNKVIEIFNPSDSVKSLNTYSLKIFQNGAPTPLDIPLSGNVNPKETYVVAHPQADANILSKANQTDVQMNFDGNDAVVLNQGQSNYIDKIGEIGVNPGSNGWTVPPSSSTKSHDLRRKYPIDQGETDWNQGKNQWNSFPPDSMQNVKQHQNACSATNDITFSFANPTESGTSPKYFEFDIMVSANNSSTYLDNAIFNIQYNSAAFGTNAVANNKVTVTKGASFNTATYIDPNAYLNNGVDTIAIPFGSDPGQTSWSRTLLTTSTIQLMHIKIEIQNCNQFTDLQFVNTGWTSNFSWYTTTAGDDPINSVPYDNTNYGTGLNQELCPFKITTYTSPVNAGTYYTGATTTDWKLTINGNGFGNTRGNGNVYLLDADTNGIYLPMNAKDFISWNDTKIEIRIPSVVDSFSINSVLKRHTPSSGLFYVKTNAGDSTISALPIDIPYGIKNGIDPLVPEGKIRADLVRANKNDSSLITFHLDTSITNHPNPMVEAIIRKAIKAWRCEALVYFVVGSDMTINTAAQDGVSVIFMTDVVDPNNPNVIGQTTFSNLAACGDINGNKHFFPTEIDIAFSRTTPWMFDTSGTLLTTGLSDFYEVALHEVGHAALMTHTRAPNAIDNAKEIMYWQALLGPVAGADRRYITTDAETGGLDVVFRSEALNLNTSSCNSNNVGSLFLPPDQSCGTLGLPQRFIKTPDFSIYPNPTDDNFTVEFEIRNNANVQFSIYDYTGKEISRMEKRQITKGKYQEQFNIQPFVSGLYFFVANISGQVRTMKIIKM